MLSIRIGISKYGREFPDYLLRGAWKMIRKRWIIFGSVGTVFLLLFLYMFVFAGNQTACESPREYSLNPDVKGSLGVLIAYMDPGIDHTRAPRVFDAARNAGAKWVSDSPLLPG